MTNTPADALPDLGDACVAAAAAAADDYAATAAAPRAALLDALADALDGQREALVALADEETRLGPQRLQGEVARTTFQLRGFAQHIRDGAPYAVVAEPALSAPPPRGRPALLRVRVPLGPVAMFAASNFPFAFSVLGGDTASALAAGCPVVVKAHPAHPALARAVAALAREVVAAQGLPSGILSLVEGAGHAVGVGLVRHPAIAAVAFTGSLRGGLALQREVQARPRPIPFYGELGSINPVVVLPAALGPGGEAAAQSLAASIALGCGQFCTSPGVVVVPQGDDGDAFVAALVQALRLQTLHPMLSPQIRAGFDQGRSRWLAHPALQPLLADAAADALAPRPLLAQVGATDFVADAALHEEVFGPAALVVRTAAPAQAIPVLRAIGGSLTVTLWGAEDGDTTTRELVRAAMQIAGRVLFAGLPTGVAVCAAQQHGGPWPASTAPATTSVGWAAIDRFLRPVALQDAPPWLRVRSGLPC